MTEQREIIASSIMTELWKTVPGFSQADEQFLRGRFAAWRNINPAVKALEVSATDLGDPEYPKRIKKLTSEFREWLGGRWKT